MNPAVPTPFDIIPPPPPLWTPAPYVWLLLVVIVLGSIFLILAKRRKIPPPPLGYRDQLLADIRRCIYQHERIDLGHTTDLEHVVQLALRALSYTTGEEFGSESAHSLRQRAKTAPNSVVSRVMEKISDSKDLLYAPRSLEEARTSAAKSLAVMLEELLSATIVTETQE